MNRYKEYIDTETKYPDIQALKQSLIKANYNQIQFKYLKVYSLYFTNPRVCVYVKSISSVYKW